MARFVSTFMVVLSLVILASGCAGTSGRSGPIHTGPIFGDAGTIAAGER